MSNGFSAVVNGLTGAMQSALGIRPGITPALHSLAPSVDVPTGQYQLMRALVSSSPYSNLESFLPAYGLQGVTIQGLRNPTHAVCSVYRATLWAGTIREDDEQSALPLVIHPNVEAKGKQAENLRARIHDVWRRSNLDRQKSQIAFDLPLLGDQVFKVTGNPDSAHPQFQLVQPEHMTDIDTDSRGYMTFIRIDVPYITRDASGMLRRWYRTEIWDKAADRYRMWRNELSSFNPVGDLGTPEVDTPLDQQFGVDFLPFVQMKFAESSASLRGVPAVMHALDKIIYGDALTTALHQRLTNHNVPDKVLSSNVVDAMGLPIQPPKLADTAKVSIDGETFWALPSGWSLTDTVAALDYANHLAVVNSHYDTLAMTDLPELAWYQVMRDQRLSGVAFDFKMIPARARIDEVRGNAENALIRITQMALTVGQQLGLPGYDTGSIGTYENGDFEFWIADRPIVPTSPQEQATLEATRATTLASLAANLPLESAMRNAGYPEDAITDAEITGSIAP